MTRTLNSRKSQAWFRLSFKPFCVPFNQTDGDESRVRHNCSGENLCENLRPARCFKLSELKRATRNFHEDTILDGENENFTIHRGYLCHKEKVRVRRTMLENRVTLEQFQSEMRSLSSVHHRNLVRLVGFCNEGGEHLLVYEDMEGTLSEKLHAHGGISLSWLQRVDIAIGVAKGLSHLHEHSDPPIVHRNIKSSSILLNNQLVPKVSEVGLSRQMNEGSEQTRVTMGYLPPEHYQTGTCSSKSDVYAYGVVLLEILTGKKSFDRERHKRQEEVLLVNMVRTAHADGEWPAVHKLVDPPILNEENCEAQKLFFEIAMSCIEEDRLLRPTMREVQSRLEALVPSRATFP